jgi:hypothetical protein
METTEYSNDQDVPLEAENDTMLSPLLPDDSSNDNHSQVGVRQRREALQSRLLDRDATFHQSHGRWGVERLSRRHQRHLMSRLWHDWIFGDWFHRLAYQRTSVLMGILFVMYASIVVFFAFVYYGVSILGQQTVINPDGSKKIIAFCDMEYVIHLRAAM